MTTNPPDSVRPGDALTERELQVLWLAANGATTLAISLKLHITSDTVKTHGRRLRRKLGARNTAHAVALGLARGAISMPAGSNPKIWPAPSTVAS